MRPIQQTTRAPQQTTRARRFATLFVGALIALAAPRASAQTDDDDILAPAEPTAPVAAPSTKKVGLVNLVAVGDASKPLAEQVTTRLQKELTDGKLEVTTLSLAPAGGAAVVDAGADAAQKAKVVAEKELAKGQKLLAQMQLGRAETAFQKAATELQTAGPALTDTALLVDTQLGLAEVFARQGMEDEANAALTVAATHHPELVLDTAKYPPQFIRSFQKLRDRVVAGDKGTLFVDETARGATITLGAKAVGTAPLRIGDVPAGVHLVRLELPGVGAVSSLVEVTAGLESTVSGGFFAKGGTSPEDVLAANQLDAESVRAIAEATKAAGLDIALAGVVGKKRSTVPVALVAVRPTGEATRVPTLDFDGDLLNLAIETLKAKETVLAHVAAPAAAYEPGVLLDGMKVGVVEVAAITLRYELSSAGPSETRTDRKTRVAGAEPDDDGRRIIEGGQSGRRRTLKKDDDRISTRAPRTELTTTEESDSILTSPWLWVGVGSGTAVVVGAVATGAALAIWYFILPPTSAEVSVTLPE